jgi:hypothetical protein
MIRSIFLLFLLVTGTLHSDETAVYLTWQQHPESTMTIQWISPNSLNDDTLYFSASEKNSWFSAMGYHFPMPEKYPYFIHRIELVNLEPDTVYSFYIPSIEASYKFRTAPDHLTKPLSFVVGGDVYHDNIKYVAEMNQQAALANPLFALVGGDIAYSCHKAAWLHRWGIIREKMDRWMLWLQTWQNTMITPEGCLIPIVPAIGNHDVMGGYNQPSERAQFFYALFPMKGFRANYTLDFGSYLSLIVLDSDHTQSIEGAQTNWLNHVLQQRQYVQHKFALYHVGAYPSVRNFEGSVNKKVRQYWVPLFEKYGLNAAFENHDHAYKRTHLLLNGKTDSRGVLYIGDGGWGVKHPRTPYTPEKAEYLAKSAPERTVTSVRITPKGREYKAIDSLGKIIDRYSH